MKKLLKNLLVATLVITIANSSCFISSFPNSSQGIGTYSGRNTGGEPSTN